MNTNPLPSGTTRALPNLAQNTHFDNVLCGWLPICKDYFDWMTFGRVQSCVRPVDAECLDYRWP